MGKRVTDLNRDIVCIFYIELRLAWAIISC